MSNSISFAQFQGPQQVRRSINNPAANSLLGFDSNSHVANITDISTILQGSTGALTSASPTAGIGYAIGAGAAGVQGTSVTTTVVATGMSGTITTFAQNLAAGANVSFTVTNTSVAVGDVPIVAIRSGSIGGTSHARVTGVAAGSFIINIGNANASVAETGNLIINFAVIKAVSS